ncbi:DUF1635 domain-containing protein [Paenibacillus sp. ACRRY]|uniref:DUF1635 domain-containing protein n=1 Tax=Paenibacillus sp. ACRRY TaxID=2918208 RepID=UPI001EF65CEC|nr:DUF1635 domain-containing protein [Paenibacillus sp. ACRRY]MCG7385118.1 DUF1635 domain-containing protein [Paenibacillus sp. ACRRY]
MSWLDTLKEVLPLAEKYGLALVLMFVLFGVCIYLVRSAITDARKERDEAQEQLQKLTEKMNAEREKFMEPLLNMVNNLKKDSGEDRGG